MVGLLLEHRILGLLHGIMVFVLGLTSKLIALNAFSNPQLFAKNRHCAAFSAASPQGTGAGMARFTAIRTDTYATFVKFCRRCNHPPRKKWPPLAWAEAATMLCDKSDKDYRSRGLEAEGIRPDYCRGIRDAYDCNLSIRIRFDGYVAAFSPEITDIQLGTSSHLVIHDRLLVADPSVATE